MSKVQANMLNQNDLVSVEGVNGLVNWVQDDKVGVYMMDGTNKGLVITVDISKVKVLDSVRQAIAKMSTEELEAELARMRIERAKKAPPSRPRTPSAGGKSTVAKNTVWGEDL